MRFCVVLPAMMLSSNSDACTPKYASRLLPMGQAEQGSSAQGHLYGRNTHIDEYLMAMLTNLECSWNSSL